MTSTRWKLGAVAVVVMLSASFLNADTINGTAGAGWQSSYTTNENGSPYWDNTSSDGSQKNIGYCMAGAASCGMPGAPGAIAYWGNSNGTADLHVTFTPSGQDTAALQIEIAGYANLNQFGYHDASGDHILFTGPQGAGATASFQATGAYSFFIVSGDGNTYYTDSSLNSSDSTFQHFSIFGNTTPGTFWLGAEDLASSSSDKDYNDLVVRVSSSPVPEPGTLSLLGLGVLGVAKRLRRKLLA